MTTGWQPGSEGGRLGDETMRPTDGMKLYVSLIGGRPGFSVGNGYYLLRRNGWVMTSDGRYAAPETAIAKIEEAR